MFSNAWKPQIPRKPPDESGGGERIPRQFFLNFLRQIGSFHGK